MKDEEVIIIQILVTGSCCTMRYIYFRSCEMMHRFIDGPSLVSQNLTFPLWYIPACKSPPKLRFIVHSPECLPTIWAFVGGGFPDQAFTCLDRSRRRMIQSRLQLAFVAPSLDVDTEMTYLTIISMHRQLQYPNIAKRLASIKPTRDNQSTIMQNRSMIAPRLRTLPINFPPIPIHRHEIQ